MKKICFKCKEEKDLTNFHKRSAMKDGFLNKCSACVVNDVYIWRTKNPEARKKEYIKTKQKLGITRTQQEYFIELRKNGKGRKVSIHEYCSKRRMRTNKVSMTEFDELVQKEASDLCDMREKITMIKWHIDHIVPLNHKEACGLHNGYNLQVVPALWNIKKGNRNMKTYFGY
jgi:hypothetical protein